jgi:hypothetical protein
MKREKPRCGGRYKQVGLAVQCRDQAIDAFALQDGGEFGATGCHLADRAVEIDIRNQPGIAVAAHQIIDFN